MVKAYSGWQPTARLVVSDQASKALARVRAQRLGSPGVAREHGRRQDPVLPNQAAAVRLVAKAHDGGGQHVLQVRQHQIGKVPAAA